MKIVTGKTPNIELIDSQMNVICYYYSEQYRIIEKAILKTFDTKKTNDLNGIYNGDELLCKEKYNLLSFLDDSIIDQSNKKVVSMVNKYFQNLVEHNAIVKNEFESILEQINDLYSLLENNVDIDATLTFCRDSISIANILSMSRVLISDPNNLDVDNISESLFIKSLISVANGLLNKQNHNIIYFSMLERVKGYNELKEILGYLQKTDTTVIFSSSSPLIFKDIDVNIIYVDKFWDVHYLSYEEYAAYVNRSWNW